MTADDQAQQKQSTIPARHTGDHDHDHDHDHDPYSSSPLSADAYDPQDLLTDVITSGAPDYGESAQPDYSSSSRDAHAAPAEQ